MTIVITLSNAKGGVAKTTTAVNLSAGLTLHGYRVLLVDADFQSNATQSLGINLVKEDWTLFELLTGTIDPKEATYPTHVKRLDIIPGSPKLLQVESYDVEDKQFLLKHKLKLLTDHDFVIIDTSPSLNILSVNALAASNHIIIPTQPHFLSTVGLKLLLEFISTVRTFNSSSSILGILLTRVDLKDQYVQESEEELRLLLPSIFRTTIPEHRFANRAAACQQTLYEYSRRSKLTVAYKEFVLEVLVRLQLL